MGIDFAIAAIDGKTLSNGSDRKLVASGRRPCAQRGKVTRISSARKMRSNGRSNVRRGMR